jgi:hypothetical protein
MAIPTEMNSKIEMADYGFRRIGSLTGYRHAI